MPDYNGWQYEARVEVVNERVLRYSIAFYRPREGGWYDEIRYDSHDRAKGQRRLAPHFHMKIKSALKRDGFRAIQEIKDIIALQLPGIAEVTEQ
jgi:spermidine synthase